MTARATSQQAPVAPLAEAAASPRIDSAAVDHFEQLIRRQLEQFERLEQYAHEQTDLIARGEADGLLALLGRRQQVINELTELHRQAEPIRQCWDSFYEELEPARRERLGGMLKRVQELLGRIIEQDGRDRDRLAAARSAVGDNLHKIAVAGAAVRAYGNRAAAARPRFADGRG